MLCARVFSLVLAHGVFLQLSLATSMGLDTQSVWESHERRRRSYVLCLREQVTTSQELYLSLGSPMQQTMCLPTTRRPLTTLLFLSRVTHLRQHSLAAARAQLVVLRPAVTPWSFLGATLGLLMLRQDVCLWHG